MKVIATFLAVAFAMTSSFAQVPSSPGVDAPELAGIGKNGVGFRSINLIHKNQPDLENVDLQSEAVNQIDRQLRVDIWYPAKIRKRSKAVTYTGSLWGEPPLPSVSFSQNGIAVEGADPIGSRHPLVIVSHGYSNNPAVMTWLTENLASKGHVVAAIHHRDPNPYIASPSKRAAPNFYRPKDIAFVAGELRARLGSQIDPANVALIGYSQGGYGVITAGGATLDPEGPNMALVAGGMMKNLARGGVGAGDIKVPGVKAIIALAPGGGFPKSAWGATGLAAISSPLLLIQGDQDPVVDYKTGALMIFNGATNADRYLLTYRQAGHSIALNPAPAEMRSSVWDIDWFEDPIWRQDRIIGINLHFITAFLAVHLRDDIAMRVYMDVPVADSDLGEWNAPAGTPWGAYSPGAPDATLWKGFQRRHARGMELRYAPPAK